MAEIATKTNLLVSTSVLTQTFNFTKQEEINRVSRRIKGQELYLGKETIEKIHNYFLSQKVLKNVIETNHYTFTENKYIEAISEEVDNVTKVNFLDLILFNPSFLMKIKLILKMEDLMGDAEDCIFGTLDSHIKTPGGEELYPIAIIKLIGKPEIHHVTLASFENLGVLILLKKKKPSVKIIEKDQRFEKEKRNQRKKNLIFPVPSFSPGYYP